MMHRQPHDGRQKVLVTGPDGFVGVPLCRELLIRGFSVLGAQWKPAPLPEGCRSVVVGDIGRDTAWRAALEGVGAVVHLAARVHIMNERANDPLTEFRRINVEGTRRLIEEAAGAGVKRFVFMSTIKVNGEQTADGGVGDGGNRDRERGVARGLVTAFREEDPPDPGDPYGISKWESEAVVREVTARSGMEYVILRAPLIYGPGVKGNFASLLKLARSGIPLPLGAVGNRRSLLYLGNLVDFIARCLVHPAAANETFLVADGTDLSTAELLRELRKAMGRRAGLVPVPFSWLNGLGRVTGKAAVVQRLCGSLRVDAGKARRLIGWTPPFTVQQGLHETVRHFIKERN